MNIHGIEINIRHKPKLDPAFAPFTIFNQNFLKTADKNFDIAIMRDGGQTSVFKTCIHGTPFMRAADEYYIDRLVKTLLWIKGGYRICIAGDKNIYEYIKKAYSPEGSRSFDFDFMSRVYERALEVEHCNAIPEQIEKSISVGGQLKGCRIGFDAGGSDRKVSAVIDGEPVFSEEIIWHPKTNPDPDYHFREIVSAFKTAAAHMPRVDAIGISSAGVYINNKTMAASLFLSVPPDDFHKKVKDIYLRAAAEIGDVKINVCNDGDVTALAGAMSLEENNILGIAMGTSEAGGYVDKAGNITGWLNELAFVPVDANPDAMRDEWSGDIGCGVKYFSQDAVIKLAGHGGIVFEETHTPAQKLKYVQQLLEQGDSTAYEVYASIGVYLGHALAHYHEFYGFGRVLLMGRVTSGRGGDIIISVAEKVLKEEYSEISKLFALSLPDEKSRRVGQSIAAASLPEI